MVIRAALRIRHTGCLTERFHSETFLTQISGERGADVFVLRAPDHVRLREGLAIAESKGRKAEILSETEECIVFKGHNEEAGIVAAIRESPCWIVWPIVYRDGHEHYTIGAPGRKELRALLARLEGLGDVRIEQVSEGDAQGAEEVIALGDLVADLTPRQLRMLKTAVDRGYYRSPREVTTDSLATSFDVSASTIREHLHKAESSVLARVALLLERRPSAMGRASRKVGRPRRRI